MADWSLIVPKLFASALDKAGNEIVQLALSGGRKLIDTLRLNVSDYLFSTIERTSKVKTLLNKDEPAQLLSIYVRTYLKTGSKRVRDNQLVERARSAASFIIIGSAGSGKSILIRYLFLQLVEGGFGIIPILLELRRLNSSQYAGDLVQFLYDSVTRPGGIITKDQFKDYLRSGMFILILDGLDEVDFNDRKNVEEQILNLREAYSKLGVIIASRPDESLRSWTDFALYYIEPMNKAQVKALIRKLSYDPQLRSHFLREVDGHLWDEHESFLWLY